MSLSSAHSNESQCSFQSYNETGFNLQLPTLTPLPADLFNRYRVIFVIGGPGAGKGTQCSRLASEEPFLFKHLSAGDLLRTEQASNPSSPYALIIKERISKGLIVPMQITIALLQKAIIKEIDSKVAPLVPKRTFLIDGFPRAIDQGVEFERVCGQASGIVSLECSEQAMLSRILHRSNQSGRDDDNKEAVLKRFDTYQVQSKPVVDYYMLKGRQIKHIDTEPDKETVYSEFKKAILTLIRK